MRATRPPRLSTWLLERFVGGPRRESLVGDLLEQYPRRRSAAWYWRQVITAIMVSGARDISAHKLLAVRAVAIGGLVSVLFTVPVHWLSEMTRALINDWIVASGHYSFWPVLLSGPITQAFFQCVAGAAIGGIVARLQRAYAAAMVCLVSVSIQLFEVGLVTLLLTRQLLSTQPHGPMPQAALMLAPLLAMGKPFGVLMGGLWTVRPVADSLGMPTDN